MNRFAAVPAEEYSDSDDEFMLPISGHVPGHQSVINSYTAVDDNENGGGSGETPWFKPVCSTHTARPKSRIPISSPITNGVTSEDFRFAIIRGNIEATQRSLEKGVDINMKFRTGWTPLMYAAHQVNLALVQLLLEHGANPNTGLPTPLMTCCTSSLTQRHEDMKRCISLLIEAGSDVDITDQYAVTPLMMACKKGHAGAVEILIERSSNINQAEKKGFTALAFACNGGHLSCAKILVQNGADVNTKTLEGQSLLMLAQSSRHSQQMSSYVKSLSDYRNDDIECMISLPEDTVPDNHDSNLRNQHHDNPHTSVSMNKFGDVEVFLYGLELSSLIPCFHEHNITMEHLLLITDDELMKMGVASVGHRKRILDSVHEIHKSDWQPSSIPAYEKVRSSKQLSPAEVTAMIASIASHSSCLTASMKYIRSQIVNNPALLQVSKNGQGLHALRLFLHEVKVNTDLQVESCTLLHKQIEQTLSSGEAETIDFIAQETTQASSYKSVVVAGTLISLGVVSLAAIVYLRKFPYIRALS